MNKRFILIILLLAILPIVRAEFNLGTQPETKISCATEINLFTVPVTNNGASLQTYTVSLSGSAAKWAVAAPPGFVLSPGETQTVFVYATPAKGTPIGNYNLRITVTDSSGSTKSVVETINIKECFGVSLATDVASQAVCACMPVGYSLTLANTGEWADNFRLSLSGSASRWASLSEEIVRLEPGASREINVHVAPGCDDIGAYGLTVTASSDKSEAVSSVQLGLVVEGCYDFMASVAENYHSFCENSEIKVPLTIENTGTSEDSYSIKASGPSGWIALEKNSVTINGGGGAEVNVVAFPKFKVSGKFPVKVTIESEKGEQTEAIDLTLNVLTCYAIDLKLDFDKDNICPGTSTTHKVSVTNNGDFPEKYGLKVSGADWASLSESFATLGAAESKDFDLILNPPVDAAEGNYHVKVTIESQEVSKTSDSKTVVVVLKPKSACYGVVIRPEIRAIEVKYGESTLVPISVKNTGAEKAEFTLDISGTGASYAQFNPAVVSVEAGKSETAYLYISIPEETSRIIYDLTISARDADGLVSGSEIISFKVVEELTEIIPTIPKTVEKVNETVGWAKGWRDRINAKTEAGLKLVKSKSLAAFAAVKGKVAQIPYVASTYNYLRVHWYFGIGVIVVIVLIIAGIIAKLASKGEGDEFIDDFYEEVKKEQKKKPKKKGPGLCKRFMDWLYAEDLEEFEIGWEVDSKKVKIADKAKPKEKKEGLWKKFIDWLEEDVPEKKVKAPKVKKAIKKKPVKKGKSAWSKFTDWLNEGEEDFFKPEPEDDDLPKAKKVKRVRNKSKGLRDKFMDWLEEEEPVRKPKNTSKKLLEKVSSKTDSSRAFSKAKGAPKKKKGKGALDKFMSWLEEE